MEIQIGLTDLNVSRETTDLLKNYVKILQMWNTKINLVSKDSIKDVWFRHILDSAQLFKFVNSDIKKWLDLGSGAGFPGLVIAILAKDKFPDLSMTLIESDKRKCVFLSEVVRELQLSVKIFPKRIQDCPQQNADIISARALSKLEKLFHYFVYHGKKDCKGLFLKGKSVRNELSLVNNIDVFKVKLGPSTVDKTGYLVEVENRVFESG
jgi:16S rRNA (guanine527-N7)-methyltransferase